MRLAYPEAEAQYRAMGHSHRRYRWDMLRAARSGDLNLYSYLNDANIDAALRSVLGITYPVAP